MNLNQTKRKLAQDLEREIQNALLRSPGVRRALARLVAFDPDCDLSKYRLSPHIEKLGAEILAPKLHG